MTGHAINQFYFPPKSLDLFQMKCNPLQMARSCTKSVLTPLECPDVSKINSYPLSSLEPILVSSTPLSLKFFDQFLPPQKCQDMPKSNLYPFNVSELSSNHFEASSKVPEFVPNQRKPLLKSLDLSQIGFNQVHWLFNSVLILSNVPELIPN